MQYSADLHPLQVGPGWASSAPGKPSSSELTLETLKGRRRAWGLATVDDEEEELEDEEEELEVAEPGAMLLGAQSILAL